MKIDEHVQREIMNHRSLNHPNIIRFKEVYTITMCYFLLLINLILILHKLHIYYEKNRSY